MTGYVYRWQDGAIDGTNSVDGPDGRVSISVATPTNAEGRCWLIGKFTSGDSDPELGAYGTSSPVSLHADFATPISDVTFEIFDVDYIAERWDDKVTIIALDEDGNQVPVEFSNLGQHSVSGNTIEADGSASSNIDGPGATDTVTVTIAGPIVSLEIVHDNGSDFEQAGTIAIGDLHFNAAGPVDPDGVVDGEAFDETMVLGYDDSNAPTDQGGDRITTGDDTIYGNGGDDSIDGDAGDDLIYGDSGRQQAAPQTERVALEWSQSPYAADRSWVEDFSQNVGGITVDVCVRSENYHLSVEHSTDQINVDGIADDGDPVNDTSSISLGSSNATAAGTVSVEFSSQVENVSFRIADLDFSASVTVNAYDGDGNRIPVEFVNAGSGVELQDEDGDGVVDTAEDADYETGSPETSPLNSVGVFIAGPVDCLEIIYDAEGNLGSSTHISDIYFDATTGAELGLAGDDTITGGAGADTIYGEEGDDVLEGGAGADSLFGGDDRDILLANGGDTVDGGAGGDDYDILDLRGLGQFYLTGPSGSGDPVPDSNGNGYDGMVIFVNDEEEPTGETISFTEIEFFRGDNVGRPPIANDDTAEVMEDSSVNIAVLLNDSDPDAQAITVISATSPDGHVAINPDGSLTFTPAADFNGPTTITYTISDPDGNEDTATVYVTVTPVNDAPIACDDSDSTDENTPVTIDLRANDRDPDGDDFIVVAASVPAEQGSLTANPDGTYVFTPADDFVGEAVISYTIEDEGGLQDSAVHLIQVREVNVAPVAVDDVLSDPILAGTAITIDALSNDSDPDGDDLAIVSASVPAAQGTVAIIGNQLVFTSNSGFEGTANITYTIEDEAGLTDTAQVYIPVSDGIVTGTGGGDLINAGYLGDPGFDNIDDEDALLPGDAPNDDVVHAGAGDDTILAGLGDDEVLGGSGDDLIDGGTGDDTLWGGDDRDRFENVNAGDSVDGGSGGDDYDILDLTDPDAAGSFTITRTNEDENGNGYDGYITYFDEDGNETGRLNFTEIEEIIPCFTPGTRIATAQGDALVETLKPGDQILTRDHGLQTLRWVGERRLTLQNLQNAPHLQPVLLQKGALGANMPERDMLVSPNHRVLINSAETALYFDAREVLVAAKHLTALPGIEVAEVTQITYIHLLFDRHEVVLSDGAWSESFQPGDMTLGAMGAAQQAEIFELFPELETRAGQERYAAARVTLKRHEAELLTSL